MVHLSAYVIVAMALNTASTLAAPIGTNMKGVRDNAPSFDGLVASMDRLRGRDNDGVILARSKRDDTMSRGYNDVKKSFSMSGRSEDEAKVSHSSREELNTRVYFGSKFGEVLRDIFH